MRNLKPETCSERLSLGRQGAEGLQRQEAKCHGSIFNSWEGGNLQGMMQYLPILLGGAKELGIVYINIIRGAKEPRNLQNHRGDIDPKALNDLKKEHM